MFKRIWDIENKYTEGFLKEYEHWVVEVSYRQHTLGCFIIFAKRSVEKISEINDIEMIELKNIIVEVESTFKKIPEYNPDSFNYMQLGNSLHHLHFHGIPRYATSRVFNNKIWEDKNWGKPPIWSFKDEDVKHIIAIRKVFTANLNK